MPPQGSTIFTKLDLRNANLLVCIKDEDEWKTTFNSTMGHFEYLVMMFGHHQIVFQALVNDVPCNFLKRFIFVYLDDILLFSKNLSEHITHVRFVLQRVSETIGSPKTFGEQVICQS